MLGACPPGFHFVPFSETDPSCQLDRPPHEMPPVPMVVQPDRPPHQMSPVPMVVQTPAPRGQSSMLAPPKRRVAKPAPASDAVKLGVLALGAYAVYKYFQRGRRRRR